MTREEAAEKLKAILAEATADEDAVCYVTSDDADALEMAIKALEHEHCEDTISRREAIKMFTYNYKGERIPDYDCDNFPTQIYIKTVKEILKELPSVEPERKNDSMTVDDYRDRMIEVFHNADCDELISLIVLPSEKEFEHLEWLLKNHYHHSVPERISGHCKRCKYFEYDSVAKVDGIPLIVAHEICKRWGDGCKTCEDGYCFLYEPQEMEVDG